MSQPPKPEDLKELLPAQVEIALSSRASDDEHRVPAAEMTAAASMKADRRKEFIHGRACAHAALAALGKPDQPIPIGASREPVWPEGVVGSISHCGPVAAAAVARCDELGGLGIDIEFAEALDVSILNMICRESEQIWLRNADDGLLMAKLIFSAKESIFKSIWPKIGQFVDFQDIGIRIDVGANTFTPVEWSDGLPAPLIGNIAGRFMLRDGWIMTTACLQ